MTEKTITNPEELLMGKPPLERLKILRDGFSDEIPNEVLHSIDEVDKKRFKVRRGWWHGVVGDLQRLRSLGRVPLGLEEEVRGFLDHYTSDVFRYHQPLTTAEDIQRANELITKIIGDGQE